MRNETARKQLFMQMGADTREHGVLVGGSRYRRIIVICTWSRSADTIAFVPLFNIIRNDRWKSGERRYIGQNHLHVHVPNACQKRERHVIGHIHLGCRTRTIPVSILVTFRSPRASNARRIVHAVGSRRGSISRSPRISPTAALVATSNRVTHGVDVNMAAKNVAWWKRDSGIRANSERYVAW